jgi:quercetin dioxygenase-like cupin family protein
METMTRRSAVVGTLSLAAVAMGGLGAAAEQKAEAEPHTQTGDFAGGSKVFALACVTPTKLPNGSQRIGVFSGTLATGEKLSMHESWVPPGLAPAAIHRITHSEVVVVLEGEVEFVHDGKTDTAKAGEVIYVAYGTNHAMRNVGAATARYVVLQVGGDTK